jgi:hypothetical protein
VFYDLTKTNHEIGVNANEFYIWEGHEHCQLLQENEDKQCLFSVRHNIVPTLLFLQHCSYSIVRQGVINTGLEWSKSTFSSSSRLYRGLLLMNSSWRKLIVVAKKLIVESLASSSMVLYTHNKNY